MLPLYKRKKISQELMSSISDYHNPNTIEICKNYLKFRAKMTL